MNESNIVIQLTLKTQETNMTSRSIIRAGYLIEKKEEWQNHVLGAQEERHEVKIIPLNKYKNIQVCNISIFLQAMYADDEDSSSEGLYEFDGFYTSDLVEQDERKKLLVENQDLNNQIKQLRNEMKRNEQLKKKVI